jgi:hypothetical protein
MLKNTRIGIFHCKRINSCISPERQGNNSTPFKRMLVTKRSKYLIILILLLIPILSSFGQGEESKKAAKYFENAKYYYDLGRWEDCKTALSKVIKTDSTFTDAYILFGDVLLETGKPGEAVYSYRKALQFNPKEKEEIQELLANTLFNLERYGEAISEYELILSNTDLKPDLKSEALNKVNLARARKKLIDNPVSFNPLNLGSGVNTAADEYINALTADGSGFFFTKRTKNPGHPEKQYNEDFYYASFEGDSAGLAFLLSYPPGKENDAGALCISPDGRLLFFTACFRPDSYGGCDLYYSEKQGDTWSKVKNVGPVVNSKSWDSQPSISSDGKTLYFASKRAGGLGSSDIWKSERRPDGQWGKPVNLGAPLNTSGGEMAPFMHYDNSTLYFSSNGHPGMGGSDLFKSVYRNEAWSQPENLGYPICSSADELVIVVNPEGNRGYISSNTLKGKGGYDIFRFDLYEAIRPTPVSYLKGKVYDKETGKPLEASFELIDIKLDSTIIEAVSDRQNGEFLVCLPSDRNYALNVSCKGYLFYSDNFPFSEIKSRMDPLVKDIPLEPIAVGNSMTLRNIFFDTDQFLLKSTSYAELGKLVAFLTDNPSLRIEIEGHTDNEGTESYNLELSMKRAQSVYEYLLDHNISASRLSFKGYGESRPVSSNDTEEGRAFNRRTEIRISGTD